VLVYWVFCLPLAHSLSCIYTYLFLCYPPEGLSAGDNFLICGLSSYLNLDIVQGISSGARVKLMKLLKEEKQSGKEKERY
jgi:hypothetical protein